MRREEERQEDLVIKGPGIRLDLDVRRVWRCPTCQRVLKTAGHVVSRRCPTDDSWMEIDDKDHRFGHPFPLTIPETGSADDDTDAADDDRPRKQSRKHKRRRRGQRRDRDAESTGTPDEQPASESTGNGDDETTSGDAEPVSQ